MGYAINNHTKIVIKSQKDFSETVLLDTEQGITGDVVAGLPVIDVIDDSLDSFVFKINDYPIRKPFTPFDLIEFTVAGEKTQYFVLTDKSSTYSQERRTYTHTIACVETTKYLEKVKIFNLTLTNKNDTLRDQFRKALNNAETIYLQGGKLATPRFQVSSTLGLFIFNKESRDFHFGNTDLRTVLDSMLNTHNSRVIVKNVSFDQSIQAYTFSLGYHLTNVANDITPLWDFEHHGQILHEESESDGQDYAGQIVATGYNALSENTLTVRDSARSSEAQLSDKSIEVFLPFPISDRGIKYFAVRTGVARLGGAYEVVEIDLTEYLLPREQYDLLDETDKRWYLPYDIGGTQINLNAYYKRWHGEENLVFDDFIKEKIVAKINDYDGHNEDIKALVYIVTYYPSYTAPAVITKPSAYSNANQRCMSIMDSQTEKTLDVDLYGRKLSGLIKRTGNDTYCVDVKAEYYKNLLPLLSRISLPFTGEENYVLYKREYAIYDNFVNCRYYFSQNYNAVQENAGVNREQHLFDIPLESQEAPIILKKYLHFSSSEDLVSNYSFTYRPSYGIMESLVGKNTYGELKHLFFQSTIATGGVEAEKFPQDTEGLKENEFPYKGNENLRFILPLGKYTLDKTMNFMAKPLDNFSVGYSRTGYIFSIWGDGGYRALYNRYVSKKERYIGEIETFNIGYSFDVPAETVEGQSVRIVSPTLGYPMINKSYQDLVMQSDIKIKYYKDRAQTPVFVLSLEMTVAEQDKGKIFVTPTFAKMNNLIRDNGNGLQGLKLYVSYDKVLDEDEEYLPSEYTTGELTGDANYFFEVKQTTNGAVLQCITGIDYISPPNKVKSWCIADNKGRIYLAVNGKVQNIYACVSDNP